MLVLISEFSRPVPHQGVARVGLERVTNHLFCTYEIPTTATVNRAETQPTFVLAVI